MLLQHYTGVEGLTFGYGVGEVETKLLVQHLMMIMLQLMKASYAYGPITVGYSRSEYDDNMLHN